MNNLSLPNRLLDKWFRGVSYNVPCSRRDPALEMIFNALR